MLESHQPRLPQFCKSSEALCLASGNRRNLRDKYNPNIQKREDFFFCHFIQLHLAYDRTQRSHRKACCRLLERTRAPPHCLSTIVHCTCLLGVLLGAPTLPLLFLGVPCFQDTSTQGISVLFMQPFTLKDEGTAPFRQRAGLLTACF